MNIDFNCNIEWLLAGDVSICYQTYRDLLNSERADLKEKISEEGWGFLYLSLRKEDGNWGDGFYQPKWISTHYTLLDLKYLNISNSIPPICESLLNIFNNEKGSDGGINPGKTISCSDVCINGMVLNYASYFRIDGSELLSVIDFIIPQHMPDGGFNCFSNRKGAAHSSLHSTISVAEGINEYLKNGYTYRASELKKIEAAAQEFILQHRLFRSDKTGQIINKNFLLLSYPSRWKYDILRALDYFRSADLKYDARMNEALEILINKKRTDDKWPLQAKHSGKTHFDMEKAGQSSRWNTLRALRVLKYYGI
jgi:hypothetical protein